MIFIDFNNCFSQSDSISKQTIKVLTRIKKLDYIFLDSKITQKSIRLANQLNSVTTNKELTSIITNDSDRLILCFAFWILAKRQDTIINKIYHDTKILREKHDYIKILNHYSHQVPSFIIDTEYTFIDDIYLNKKYLDLIHQN